MKFLIVIAFLLMVGCGSDGLNGAKGPKGDTGAAGPSGADGKDAVDCQFACDKGWLYIRCCGQPEIKVKGSKCEQS